MRGLKVNVWRPSFTEKGLLLAKRKKCTSPSSKKKKKCTSSSKKGKKCTSPSKKGKKCTSPSRKEKGTPSRKKAPLPAARPAQTQSWEHQRCQKLLADRSYQLSHPKQLKSAISTKNISFSYLQNLSFRALMGDGGPCWCPSTWSSPCTSATAPLRSHRHLPCATKIPVKNCQIQLTKILAHLPMLDCYGGAVQKETGSALSPPVGAVLHLYLWAVGTQPI